MLTSAEPPRQRASRSTVSKKGSELFIISSDPFSALPPFPLRKSGWGSRSTSPSPIGLGNDAPTRTSTDSCGSSSPKGRTSRRSAPATPQAPNNCSTNDPANDLATAHPTKSSMNESVAIDSVRHPVSGQPSAFSQGWCKGDGRQEAVVHNHSVSCPLSPDPPFCHPINPRAKLKTPRILSTALPH